MLQYDWLVSQCFLVRIMDNFQYSTSKSLDLKCKSTLFFLQGHPTACQHLLEGRSKERKGEHQR